MTTALLVMLAALAAPRGTPNKKPRANTPVLSINADTGVVGSAGPHHPPAGAAKNATVLREYDAVALMPLTSLGSTEEAVIAIERVLSGELKKLLKERLFSKTELGAQYSEVHLAALACDGVLDCLIEVFAGYGWEAFIVGNIAGLGDDRVINLKLIDARQGREVRRASEKATGNESELISQMRKAVVQLLAPELFVGTLEVRAEQPNVRILLDGQLVGTTPLKSSRLTVLAGRHAVEAEGEGLVPFESMVDVTYGEVVPLTVFLPDNTVFVGGETPFRARWWTWTAAALGAVSAGLGGYFYYQHTQTADRIALRARDGSLTYQSADLAQDLDREYKTAVGFGGAGGGILLGVSVLLLVDLF